jgi:hypothetical protein
MITTVVAHYNEDVSWTKKLTGPVFIYSKGVCAEGGIPLPNMGREAHTWAHHIVHNYEKLAPKTAFLQGDPFDQPNREPILDIVEQINSGNFRDHYKEISLFDSGCVRVCDEDGCDILNNPLPKLKSRIKIAVWTALGRPVVHFVPMRAGCQEVFGKGLQKFPYTPGAMFVVPRENILRRPKAFYEHLLHLDWGNNEKWPYNGMMWSHVLERLWLTIFDRDSKI